MDVKAINALINRAKTKDDKRLTGFNHVTINSVPDK